MLVAVRPQPGWEDESIAVSVDCTLTRPESSIRSIYLPELHGVGEAREAREIADEHKDARHHPLEPIRQLHARRAGHLHATSPHPHRNPLTRCVSPARARERRCDAKRMERWSDGVEDRGASESRESIVASVSEAVSVRHPAVWWRRSPPPPVRWVEVGSHRPGCACASRITLPFTAPPCSST